MTNPHRELLVDILVRRAMRRCRLQVGTLCFGSAVCGYVVGFVAASLLR